MADSFVVPQAVRDAAKRGLALRKQWGRGGLDTRQAAEAGVGSGVARARDLIGGRVSLDTVKRMRNFFNRHGTASEEKNDKGEPTARAIAVLLWGGKPGAAWANRVLAEEARDKEARDGAKNKSKEESAKKSLYDEALQLVMPEMLLLIKKALATDLSGADSVETLGIQEDGVQENEGGEL